MDWSHVLWTSQASKLTPLFNGEQHRLAETLPSPNKFLPVVPSMTANCHLLILYLFLQPLTLLTNTGCWSHRQSSGQDLRWHYVLSFHICAVYIVCIWSMGKQYSLLFEG